MGQIFQGDIAYVLSQGEYSQGDQVLIRYDDLHDLSNAKESCSSCNCSSCGNDTPAKDSLQIFGVTPEMAADFLFWSTATFVIAGVVNLSLTTHHWPWLNVVILSLVSGYGYYKGRNRNS